MINLASLDTATACDTPFDLELLHPKTKEPTGLVIQVLGKDSAPVRAVMKEQQDRAEKRRFERMRSGKIDVPSQEDDERDGIALLVAATVGWHEKKKGKIEAGMPFGEKRLIFSKEEAERLYTNPGFAWLIKQVSDGVTDLANFMKG